MKYKLKMDFYIEILPPGKDRLTYTITATSEGKKKLVIEGPDYKMEYRAPTEESADFVAKELQRLFKTLHVELPIKKQL